MARNLMIFGPKNSQRRELFRENFSNERDERKVIEKFEKYFENFFENFFKKFSNVSKSFRSFCSFEKFSKNRLRRDDSFGLKIVEIGAILAIFRPFEFF